MTLQMAFEFGCNALESADIEDAKVDAWLLLEYVTGVTRAQYYMDMQREISAEQEEAYRACIDKRVSRIPLQHITGVQEFMGMEFCVNEHVLIPRQDTEVLVEHVLDTLQCDMRILDMCTGSGCILISLLKLKEGISGVGVDISKEALCVAKENGRQHGVDAEFIHSDLFENVQGDFDVIVSNPPYIRTAVIEELQDEVRLHDPRMALDGLADGLYFYRKIVENSPAYLKHGGKLFFEIGHDQGTDVKCLLEAAGFEDVTVKKDLAGLDRVVSGRYNVHESNERCKETGTCGVCSQTQA